MFVVGLATAVWCVWVGLANLDAVSGELRLYDRNDDLFVARCEARCWNFKNRNKCTKQCLLKAAVKPGQCPGSEASVPPFAAICLNTCKHDSQCPGIGKCCEHRCGVTCQHPQVVELENGIPDIPTGLTVTERQRKRTVHLKWAPGKSPPGTVVYVVEEHHHAGQNFMETRMSDWALCARTVKPYAVLKRLVKPGRWYQFRVAAVNENGTRGFSEDSLRFITSAGPRPPKLPQNVTVGPLVEKNGSLSSELRWKAPHSDFPIERYKVYWSKRLHGVSALDSVLVHQQVVSKERTKFLLKNLQPNSLYFIQVQALAQFGAEKLKGEKSGLVLNTSNYTNSTDNFVSIDGNQQGRVEGLRLQRVYWSAGEIRARVTWKSRQGAKRYTVSWWGGTCSRNNNRNLHLTLAVTTQFPNFDLYDLEFECRYRVSVREITAEGMKSLTETSISFKTPACEDLQKRYQDVVCLD